MNKKTRIAIILPLYNEESVIEQSYDTLLAFLCKQKEYEWKIIFVDDGSTDSTSTLLGQKMKSDIAEHVSCTLLHHDKNKGKGASIQTGLKHAEAEVYGYMDADLSIAFEAAIPRGITALQQGDIVIGQRRSRAEQYGTSRRFFSWSFGWIGRNVFRLPYRDIQCGFKWMNESGKQQALAVEQSRFSFDLEFLVRAKKQKLAIETVSVEWQHTQETSVALKDGVRYILDLLSIVEIAFSARTYTWIYIGSAVVVVAAVFGWVVPYGYFFSDDFTWIWHGERIARGEIQILTAHMSSFYSPVLNTFYAVLVRVIGVVPSVYLFVGLCIHATNAVLAGLLTRKLTKSAAAGLLATVLTAVAAGAYEPLVWVGANMHSIVAMFMLASILCLLAAYERPSKNALFFIGSLLFAVLAFGTKEVSVALPFIIGAVGLWFHVKQKKYLWSPSRIWYWVLIISTSLLYALKQYAAQSESVWVSSGTFSIEPIFALRLPVALLDIIIPLGSIMNAKAALPVFLFSIGFLCYLLFRGKRLVAVWFGFLWAVLTMLPVLFFQAEHWWNVLASRYTYSPRIGIVIALSALLVYMLREGRHVRLAFRFFWLLLFAVAVHIGIMGKIVSENYRYVYQSGRSLHAVAEELEELRPSKVYVRWFRPFTRNHAHVVGIFDVVADIPEDRIIFLEKEVEVSLETGEVELKWNEDEFEYQLIRDGADG